MSEISEHWEQTQAVAVSFVRQYYEMLLESPATLASWYGKDSIFSCGPLEDAAAAPQLHCGERIKERLEMLAHEMEGNTVNVLLMQTQPTLEKAVLVSVWGNFVKNDAKTEFYHTVILAPSNNDGSCSTFFIRNDTFVFLPAPTVVTVAAPAPAPTAADDAAEAVSEEPASPETVAEESATEAVAEESTASTAEPEDTVDSTPEPEATDAPVEEETAAAPAAAAPAAPTKQEPAAPKRGGWAGMLTSKDKPMGEAAAQRVQPQSRAAASSAPVVAAPESEKEKKPVAKTLSTAVLKVNAKVADSAIVAALPKSLQSHVVAVRNKSERMFIAFVEFDIVEAVDELKKHQVIINGKVAIVEVARPGPGGAVKPKQ
jgi:hypothetical protein